MFIRSCVFSICLTELGPIAKGGHMGLLVYSSRQLGVLRLHPVRGCDAALCWPLVSVVPSYAQHSSEGDEHPS